MSDSTGAVGAMRVAQALTEQARQDANPADRAIQAGIDATMRAVIADHIRGAGPSASPRSAIAEPVRGTGWQKETPLVSPVPKGSFIEGVIGGMIDHALGPAVPKKAEESGG